ncbi:Tic22 family protein [Almyronema epifaneia]|uniref:Tic22 family protein n=1 Tax=Almyronema epifaneia S1 TaxID=2991925 RepID=A0ABW6IHJ9_9CYAN
MKSLVQRIATLGLVGGTLLGSLFIGGLRALALTQEQIVDKLSTVPVFIIVDGEGRSLMASASNGGEAVEVPLVFIDGEGAEGFLENAQENNEPFAAEARVASIWLSDLYTQAQAQGGETVDFAYIPDSEELESAQAEAGEEFAGVPLFVARINGGYLPVQLGEETLVPMFFAREDLQVLIDQFEQQTNGAEATIEVEVIALEAVLQKMESPDNEELNRLLEAVRLFPDSEVVEFIRDRQAESGN